jgi:acetyl-CoA C-acetyltransferase
MTHAAASMARALRARRGRIGLLQGTGEYLTKHHAAVLSVDPPPADVPVRNHDQQSRVEAEWGPAPELIEQYAGGCRVETYTVLFTRSAEPDRGVVIARTPDGRRLVAQADDADAMEVLLDDAREAVGLQGEVHDGRDGLLHWTPLATGRRA